MKMTMLELNRHQRHVLVDKLPDVANVAAGALVFGQFLGNTTFSPRLAALGVTLWALLFAGSVILARRSE